MEEKVELLSFQQNNGQPGIGGRPPPEQQLTVRAVVIGGITGSIITASNVYFGLKVGWSFGAALFSALAGHALVSVLPRPYGDNFGPKENCTLQTAGAAAGGLSCGFVSAIPALAMLGYKFSYASLTLWTMASAFYGLFFAVPLRREVILRQRLPFPTGKATANVIATLHKDRIGTEFHPEIAHASDEPDAEELGLPSKATILLYAALAAFSWVLLAYFFPFLFNVPIFEWLFLSGVDAWLWNLHLSPAFVGAGVLMGSRVTTSFFCGSVVAWAILGPLIYSAGVVDEIWGYDDPLGTPSAQFWLLWVGVSIMVSDQVVGFALMYKQIRSALFPGRFYRPREQGEEEDPAPEHEQVPQRWWTWGLVCSATFTLLVVVLCFEMSIISAFIAIILSGVFALIGVQATGETDINPLGGIGKITQLLFAVISPNSIITNLMSANITASGAAQAADMMQDLKTGHLLRASPRAQFWAQVWGSWFGVVFSVATYSLFEAAYSIPSDAFPAPAANAWYAVALVLEEGFSALPDQSMTAACVGMVLGGSFALAKATVLKPYAARVPSALSFAIAFLVPPYYGVIVLASSLLHERFKKKIPKRWAHMAYPVASGLMAGEGIMGVIGAIFELAGLGQYRSTLFCYGTNCAT